MTTTTDDTSVLAWTPIQERIRGRIVELIRGQNRPMLATDVRLRISANLIPSAAPYITETRETYLSEWLSGSLSDYNVCICSGAVQVEIVEDAESTFEITLVWNIPIPIELVNGVLYGNQNRDGVKRLGDYCHARKLA